MSGTDVKVNVVEKIRSLLAQVKPTIASGDFDSAATLRLYIATLRDEIGKAAIEFDDYLYNARSGYKGDDFLSRPVTKVDENGNEEVVVDEDGEVVMETIEPFRKRDNAGRPKKVKPPTPEILL